MNLANLVCCFCLVAQLAHGVRWDEEYCDAADASCEIYHIHEEKRIKLVVAAIDLGTTYSGWAYQLKWQQRIDPTVFETSKWVGYDFLSRKTPTTVLIKPDGQTLEAFGYEAEKRYRILAENEKHEKYYYFRRFKMMLYGKKTLTRNTTLADDKGLELPAITVFSLAIGFLKNHLLESLNRKDSSLTMEDIHWVLTVPAIWNDMAKQFMRKSAVAAGILGEDLTIALEPEAASLYYRLLSVENRVDEKAAASLNSIQPGSKYMVLDAGGGTVDITVHEVIKGRTLKEVYRASGGPFGGTKVDLAFQQMLVTLVGDNVFEAFQRECTVDYLGVFSSFQLMKRDITPEDNTSWKVMFFPPCLNMLLKRILNTDLSSRISQTYPLNIRMRLDRLMLSNDLVKSFFTETIDCIVDKVQELLNNPSLGDVSSILLVGGFSDSPMLIHGIISNFARKVKVITSPHAELAIVKGAVLFGYTPASIGERISKFTYGVHSLTSFIEGLHNPAYKLEYDGVFRCDNILNGFVKVGDAIRYCEIQGQAEYVPVSLKNKNIHLPIYACTKKHPIYVTDESCSEIGSITIDILDKTVPLEERVFLVEFIFSDTEIRVSVTEKRTGNKNVIYLDFV